MVDQSRAHVAEPSSLHYFQGYAADYAGMSSAKAAAALPRHKYARLLNTPLPHEPSARGRDAKRPRKQGSFQGRYFDAL